MSGTMNVLGPYEFAKAPVKGWSVCFNKPSKPTCIHCMTKARIRRFLLHILHGYFANFAPSGESNHASSTSALYFAKQFRMRVAHFLRAPSFGSVIFGRLIRERPT